MKPFFILIALALVTGCNSKSDSSFGGGVPTTTESSFTRVETIGYHFNEAGCDTHPRLALSNEQFCRNIQMPSANAGCAVEKRKEFFEARCAGQVWDQAALREKVEQAKGAQMNCFVSDGPSDIDSLRRGTRYITEQYLIDPMSAIPHEGFVAVIQQELKGGVFKASIQLHRDNINGVVFAEKSDEWRDQKPGTISVDGQNPPAHVICWPSIH